MSDFSKQALVSLLILALIISVGVNVAYSQYEPGEPMPEPNIKKCVLIQCDAIDFDGQIGLDCKQIEKECLTE